MWGFKYSPGSIEGANFTAAWDVTTGSASQSIGIVDSGIARNHDELAQQLRVHSSFPFGGHDFISDASSSGDGDGRDNDPMDTSSFCGHGTHVAGIIAASTNNGSGMAGVAPNARIVPVRALGRCGGTSEDVADSIRWAAGVSVAGVPVNQNPAKVLNLSLGGTGPCNANMQSAVDSALARGAVVVVAAGNDAVLASGFSPANCKGVVAVAASNRSEERRVGKEC